MAVSQSEQAKAFRALHERPGAFVIPNPWDVGSARMLAALGYEALATTSAGYAFSQGRGDGTILRDEMLVHCKALVEATPLPVSADLEKCYGDDPVTVADTIRRAAAVGLVGASMDDWSGEAIYDFNHAAERMAAAVEVARALLSRFGPPSIIALRLGRSTDRARSLKNRAPP